MAEQWSGNPFACLQQRTQHCSCATQLLVCGGSCDLLQLRLLTMVIAGWDLPIDVTPASNGFEALLRMGQRCPDLLITDLNMPGMDGFKMIGSLHGLGRTFDDLDIVVVTALSEADIASRGGLPPQVRVFHKPVPFDELEALVRERVSALTSVA